jgi:hypothetical protein
MKFARILENPATGQRWLEIELPDDLDDEDNRSVITYARRFLDSLERKCRRTDDEVNELRRLYGAEGEAPGG